MGENDSRKYVMIKSPRNNVADIAVVEPATSWPPVGPASNWATEASLFTLSTRTVQALKWQVKANPYRGSCSYYCAVNERSPQLQHRNRTECMLLCRVCAEMVLWLCNCCACFWESNPQYIRAAMTACSLLFICLSCIWRYATLSLDGGITDIVKFFNVSDSKRTWMNDEQLLKIANVYTHLKNVWPILRHLHDHDAAAVGLPQVACSIPMQFHRYCIGSKQKPWDSWARAVQMSQGLCKCPKVSNLYTIFWLPCLPCCMISVSPPPSAHAGIVQCHIYIYIYIYIYIWYMAYLWAMVLPFIKDV